MTEMDFIRKRRSIRRFKAEQISDDALHDIEEAATLAASARNEQAWFFVIIQRKDILDQMAELTGRKNPFYQAPTLIAAFAKKEAIAPETDTALAMANMMYAALADGLGSCFIYCVKDLFNNPRYSQLAGVCGVPEGYACIGSLAIGIPDETPETPKDRNWNVFSSIR